MKFNVKDISAECYRIFAIHNDSIVMKFGVCAYDKMHCADFRFFAALLTLRTPPPL
jgi:hypothetical protein